ncbi:MAG: LD-carboxypeptidase [Bacteroidales bacterium]|nr:LD-carboxypeptidase [Bacteroidales bacterium]MCF8301988.1 LD-carboxypeptidase [Bacteroidales bacterium]
MITPPSLKQGDKIAIVAPAKKISLKEIEAAVATLKSWGLEVVLGNNLLNEHHQFSGTDEDRFSDFQQMLDDESVKAILCARGGYGTVRIIDRLNFSRFSNSPKWIIGFSDITVMHAHINQVLGIETLHAPMAFNFTEDAAQSPDIQNMKAILFGNEQPLYTLQANALNRKGNASGLIVGGNLSILYNLTGTQSDINPQGKILFIEEVDEYLYHLDRMMQQLKRSGKLSNLAGLIVGGMTKMNDNAIPFGKSAAEIIAGAVEEYDYPVCFGFPAGHLDVNQPIIMGRRVDLSVDEEVKIHFQEPEKQVVQRNQWKKILGTALFVLFLFLFIVILYNLVFKYLVN